MVVLTPEGSLRGYGSRCADVVKAPQSVRALVKSNHAVCFGLGNGDEHFITNKITGEINTIRDDAINYLQDLIIIPPGQLDQVATELASIQQAQCCNGNGGVGNGTDFGRQGR